MNIIDLAREAGMEWQGGFSRVVEYATQPELERFAHLVRAQALEEVEQKVPCGKHTDKWESCRIADYNQGWNDCRKQYAAAIQALKEQT